MNAASSRPLPLVGASSVLLFQPSETHELAATRALFEDYAQALGIDLGFQDFERELALLPGDYAEPRGKLLLALVAPDVGDDAAADVSRAETADDRGLLRHGGRSVRIAGCCALRPLDTVDYPNAAEMKRLYVRPAFRGLGVGRQLAEAILDAARHAGYACVLLDTLDDMESARALYEDLGFEAVPPYYHNPIAGSHYLKVDL
ncbi:GNAT family N-acetyltransferase [Variovorax sp. PvP013]|uniref:GNAT family N-acetyltransferase n=1 Tax=Variovorax sp. PvP013 TaxID=3156435 RepID=UPI003D23378A